MIGKTLAHYEITGPLGKGGMGEVFRARDTKLRREVALKFLPLDFAADPERVARFQREARTLASLQHSNVGSIYGFEEVDGVLFLVMELIEGEDLSEHLARGPLPVDQALEIARQIAGGLEAAHERAIVHRDLKPANVKLMTSGQAKILDFGLARAADGDGTEEDPATSPTLTAAMTQAGVILGTAAYMSPEQARGKTADYRADIWAFGCLLYEMLTGVRLFEGETVSDTLAAVLRKEPDWDALPAGLDPAVLLLLRRCLERKVTERLQHMGDARILLEETIEVPVAAEAQPAPSMKGYLILVGVLLVLSVLLNIFQKTGSGDESAGTVVGAQHLAASLAPRAPLARARAYPLGVGRPALTISPDGQNLVYVAEIDGATHLFKKRFDSAQAEAIPGTEGAYYPVFSPSGEWLAFFAEDECRKILFTGSDPVSLCDAPNPWGLTWESDQFLQIAIAEGHDLRRVNAQSGQSTTIGDTPSIGHQSMLPGSEFMVGYTSDGRGINPNSWQIVSVELSNGKIEPIIDGGFSPRYVPTGHLVYVRGGNLMAVGFDPATLTIRGNPVPVIASLRIARRSLPSYDFSATGTLVYVSGPPQTLSDLVWVDRQGHVTSLPIPAQFFGDFQISPDGQHVAITVGEEVNEVWVYDLERGTRRKISTDGDGAQPIWSPDGKWIAFSSWRTGEQACFIRPVDGSQPARKLEISEGFVGPYAWYEPDLIAYSGGGDVRIFDLEEETWVSVSGGDASEWGPHVSPDGKWIAYTSDESGRYEVYVKPLPDLTGAWAISLDGGEEPVWSRDGKSLFFRNGDDWLESKIDTESGFSASRPQVAFEGSFINVPGRSYDVSADGTRFLVIRDEGNEEFSRHVEVVLNWFDELERLVPVD